MNASEAEELSRKHSIAYLPTVILLQNGEVAASYEGAVSTQEILKLMKGVGNGKARKKAHLLCQEGELPRQHVCQPVKAYTFSMTGGMCVCSVIPCK